MAGTEERIPDLLEATLRRINVERRCGNLDKVEELYRACIAKAANAPMSTYFASKLSRFLSKVSGKDTEVLNLWSAAWFSYLEVPQSTQISLAVPSPK